MIKFKSLVIQNFMSYGAIPTTIQFDNPGTVLLLGEDLDNTANGMGANGVGKTVIINALTYGLYDQPISDIKLDNLVNWINKKNMMVAVEFEKNSHTYIVTRNRKAKAGAGGNFSTLTIDGVDQTVAGAYNVNDEIVKILGIPYELFVRIVAFSALHKPFLDLPSRHASQANQTDIIEELFQLKTLSEKAELLKKQIRGTELELETQNERAALFDKEIDRHTKQVQAAQDRVTRWEDSRVREIARLEQAIEQLQQVDITEQKHLLTELDLLEDSISKLGNTKEQLSEKKTTAAKLKKDKEHELEHLEGGTCPYCKQGYGISKKDKTTVERAFVAATHELTLLTEQLTKLDQEIKTHTIAYKKLRPRVAVTDLEQLLQIDNQIHNLQEKLTIAQSGGNPYTETLEELKLVELPKKDMTAINELNVTLEHQAFLLKLLTKKDSFVRKALLTKHLPFLNERLKTYLTELGLPHTVEFTHDMTPSISQFGHPADFGNLSNGQRARVNIALSWAFRDVLQSMHDHINICLLDEVLDVGLDDIGVQAAAKMLKRKARDEKLALYVISHRNEINSAFDRRMIIQLSGGFSSVKYEDE